MPRASQSPVAPPQRQRYRIVDERATHLVFDGRSRRITPEMRKDGVEMTDAEAEFYVAQQAIAPWDTEFKGERAEDALKISSGEHPIPKADQESKPEEKPKHKR